MPKQGSKRGANNGGTIRMRKDGLWEARVTIGTNPATGAPVRKSIYAKTQSEARKRMTELLNALDRGTYQPTSKMTVSAWMDEWLNTFCVNLKPYTIVSYKGIIKNHINANLGAMQLQAVKGVHVQKMYNAMIANTASAKTVKNVSAVLHKALSVAVKQGIIAVNPCDAAELPKMQQHEIKPLTDEEIPIFLDAIKSDYMCNAYAVCLFLGLREGELLGLSWDCVDFDKQTVTIRQQLQKQKQRGGKYVIVPFTKSNKTRTINVPPIAVEYLKREQLRQKEMQLKAGSLWSNPNNLVFTDETGENLKIFTFYSHFKKIAAAIGRPDARPHDLRHTCGSVVAANGATAKAVQTLLGHSSPSFTLSVYIHASERMRQDTADRMQGYYDSLSLTKQG